MHGRGFRGLHGVGVEAEGEQVRGAFQDERLAFAVEHDAHGASVAPFRLDEHLAAGAAGRDGGGREAAVGPSGGDGQRFDSRFGPVGVGVEDGAAFRARARGERCIFLVASTNGFARRQPCGRPYAEVGVGHVTRGTGSLGMLHQSPVVGRQFVRAEARISDGECRFFHIVVFLEGCQSLSAAGMLLRPVLTVLSPGAVAGFYKGMKFFHPVPIRYV